MTKFTIKPVLRIKEIAKEKGITLKQIADILGVEPAAISQSISGNPTIMRLQEIADILEVPITDLFEKNEELRFFVEYRGETHEIRKRDIIRLIEEPCIPEHENIRGAEYYK